MTDEEFLQGYRNWVSAPLDDATTWADHLDHIESEQTRRQIRQHSQDRG